ncbi:MAG TPA: aspartate aminotransferase family protein, partial [Acidimicrobiia bacterium]|nr:aspartate aminotransferase family protein [Acidimicrobiia bacterium]
GGDRVNRRIMDEINASGAAFLTHTVLDDELTLRVAIGAPGTTVEHIDRLWDQVTRLAKEA